MCVMFNMFALAFYVYVYFMFLSLLGVEKNMVGVGSYICETAAFDLCQ